MSGHTQGPWAVNPGAAQVDAMPSLVPVCQLLWPTDERTEAETEANARLIAAAPELLEALQKVLPLLAHRGCGFTRPTSEWAEHGSMNFDNCDCEIRLVRAAIASATGAES